MLPVSGHLSPAFLYAELLFRLTSINPVAVGLRRNRRLLAEGASACHFTGSVPFCKFPLESCADRPVRITPGVSPQTRFRGRSRKRGTPRFPRIRALAAGTPPPEEKVKGATWLNDLTGLQPSLRNASPNCFHKNRLTFTRRQSIPVGAARIPTGRDQWPETTYGKRRHAILQLNRVEFTRRLRQTAAFAAWISRCPAAPGPCAITRPRCAVVAPAPRFQPHPAARCACFHSPPAPRARWRS